MAYRDQLHPWCIVRCLPQARSITVARFRRRNEAEAHLQILRRILPTAPYTLLFDAETRPDKVEAVLSHPNPSDETGNFTA